MNKKIKIFKTDDGSIGLYSLELDEIYHSKTGAKKEAYEKFIEPCLDFVQNKRLKILDICYGIGYNTKTALKYFKNIELIDCIELDEELARNSFKFEFDEKINEIIKNNLLNQDLIHFYFDDVRKIIKKLNKKYDIIFHDGFAPYKQPQLWSVELISEISKLMYDESIYLTYNHSKPVLNALKKQNLFLGKTIKNNEYIGTICSYNKEYIKNPLNSFEIEALNTKSAITYKDKDLNLKNEEIILNHDNEVKNSNLESLSHLKKYYKKNSSKILDL